LVKQVKNIPRILIFLGTTTKAFFIPPISKAESQKPNQHPKAALWLGFWLLRSKSSPKAQPSGALDFFFLNPHSKSSFGSYLIKITLYISSFSNDLFISCSAVWRAISTLYL